MLSCRHHQRCHRQRHLAAVVVVAVVAVVVAVVATTASAVRVDAPAADELRSTLAARFAALDARAADDAWRMPTTTTTTTTTTNDDVAAVGGVSMRTQLAHLVRTFASTLARRMLFGDADADAAAAAADWRAPALSFVDVCTALARHVARVDDVNGAADAESSLTRRTLALLAANTSHTLAFDFFPVFKADVPTTATASTPARFSTSCYGASSAYFTQYDDAGFALRVDAGARTGSNWLCDELDMLSATLGAGFGWFAEFTFLDGRYERRGTWSSTAASTRERADMAYAGVRVWNFPGGAAATLVSLLSTYELLTDESPAMHRRVVEWLYTRGALWRSVFAPVPPGAYGDTGASAYVPPASRVADGTQLAITRLDLFEGFQEWSEGGVTGHTAIAFRNCSSTRAEDACTLFVHESTDVAPGGKAPYWPPPYGIIRTEYTQWMAQAQRARYLVVMLTLDDDAQRRFSANLASVNAFFDAHRGLPYGFHNFLWGQFDTPATPTRGAGLGNLPYDANSTAIFGVLFDVLAAATPPSPNATEDAYSLVLQAVNHRLGTHYTTMTSMWDDFRTARAPHRNPFDVFAETLVEVERDDWVYTWPPYKCSPARRAAEHGGCSGRSMVCDVFVLSCYQAAGIFDAVAPLQVVEQTPKDAYQMRLYNGTNEQWRGTPCAPGAQAWMRNVGCQVMGDYTLSLAANHANTIAPYAHMNERCSSAPPNWTRGPPGC